MYENGLGVDKDIGIAVLCLTAVNADTADLLMFLGRLYKQQQEYSKALEIYTKANRLFDSKDALAELGRLYEEGWGTTINVTKAIELYRMVEDNAHAQLRL